MADTTWTNQGDGLTETAKSVLMEIMSIRDDIDLELIRNKKQNERNGREAEEKSIESIDEISIGDNGIELYSNFIINPKEHTVSNVKRVQIRATKESIKNLISLFIAQYFAGPEAPRDLIKIWQDLKRRDKSNDVVHQALNKTQNKKKGK